VHTTTAKKIDVQMEHAIPYELDGGDRKPKRRLKIRVEPAAIELCLPDEKERQR
jgi:diacylglycerol kinase family enzyme